MFARATMCGLEKSMAGTILKQKEAIKNADATKGGKVLTKQRSQASEELEKMYWFG